MDEVQKITALAKHLFLRDGYHVPLVFAKGSHGNVVVALEHFGATNEERVSDMLNAGTLTACQRNVGDLELIVFVCEAWMGTNINVLPSQDPKHIEVLLINSLDARTQEERLLQFEIKRDPNGTVLDLKELIFPETGETRGSLLPAFLKGYRIISPVHN